MLRMFSSTTPPYTPLRFSDGRSVPEAQATIYLGVQLTADARQGKALSVRLGHASKEFDKLKLVWNSGLTESIKLRIFHTIFRPMIMYAAPELSYTASQIKRLDAWYMRHLRRVLRIKHSYWSRVTHHTALERAGNPSLPSSTLLSLELKHLDHILQLPTNHPAFHVSLTSAYTDKIATKKRRKGHPRQYWLRNNIKTASVWLEKTGFPSDKIAGKPTYHTAKNRPFDPLWLTGFTRQHDRWWKHVIKAPTLKGHSRIFPHRTSYIRRL